MNNIQKYISKFNNSVKYSKKRKALTKALYLSKVIHFNYTKLDGETKSYTVRYNPDYTYDIPPKDSDFIYLYDVEAGLFKHFKLIRIFDLEFEV